MTTEPDEDLVPVSVRLGDVVPPEDPEDWTRPLTWVAALGTLAGPLVSFGWFLAAPPTATVEDTVPAAPLAAAILAVGAAVAGGTQLVTARAWTATVAAALFAALVVVIAGVVLAGERQVEVASPTVAHGVAIAVGGVAGGAAAALAYVLLSQVRSRAARALPAIVVGAAVAAFTVGALFT